MNIVRAELYRYRKSIYSRAAVMAVVILAIGVCLFLTYASHGISSALLSSLGFSDSAMSAISENARKITYVYSAMSAADVVMLVSGFSVVMHICSDYDMNTIRYEQQESNSRGGCYMARLAAACLYMTCIYVIYAALSLAFSFFLPAHEDAKRESMLTSGMDTTRMPTAVIMILMEIVIVWGFTAFMFMLCELIRNQIVAVAVFIILIILVTPGISVIFNLVDAGITGEDIWIVSMLTAYSDAVVTSGKAISLCMGGILYFVVSSILGVMIYRKRRL